MYNTTFYFQVDTLFSLRDSFPVYMDVYLKAKFLPNLTVLNVGEHCIKVRFNSGDYYSPVV